jgi:hypothetical protein
MRRVCGAVSHQILRDYGDRREFDSKKRLLINIFKYSAVCFNALLAFGSVGFPHRFIERVKLIYRPAYDGFQSALIVGIMACVIEILFFHRLHQVAIVIQ